MSICVILPLQAQQTDEETVEAKEIKLNNNYTVWLKSITLSEYTVKTEKSAHLQNEPYKAVDINGALKMLGKRLKMNIVKDKIEYKYEITFKDGIVKYLDSDYDFIAYFPQLEILLFEGGHGSDQPFDLNNSNNAITFIDFPHRIRIGNPYYHVVSPDKQLRINGFHDGQDCVMRFLEKWNKSTKKYEFVGWFWGENHIFDLCYTWNWLWIDNNKAIFKNSTGGEGEFYEMEVITK